MFFYISVTLNAYLLSYMYELKLQDINKIWIRYDNNSIADDWLIDQYSALNSRKLYASKVEVASQSQKDVSISVTNHRPDNFICTLFH